MTRRNQGRSEPTVKNNAGMKRLEKRRRTRRRLRTMGKMEFGNRKCLFKDGDVLDECEIDSCALDGIGSDTEP
jgi:hypothetical protein